MRAVVAVSTVVTLSIAVAQKCELQFDPADEKCQNYVYNRALRVCKSNIGALKDGRDENGNCVVNVISEGGAEEISVGDTVLAYSISEEHMPTCDEDGESLSMLRGGSSGESPTQGRMGDLRFDSQVENFSEDAGFYSRYHAYSDFLKRWDAMTLRGAPSGLVSQEIIGKTIEGRGIRMIRIGKTNEDAPIRVFINGQQHAREWAAGIVTTFIADVLIDVLVGSAAAGNTTKLADQSRLKDLLSSVEVLIAPIVNPDGYVRTNRSRFHRKNMRQFSDIACIGVDLNRNWAVEWNGGQSTSTNRCEDIYVGEKEFSEPETQALRDVLRAEENDGIVAHLDVHSYGGMILGPWAYEQRVPPENGEEWMKFGKAIADGVKSVRGTVYRYGLGNANILPYAASGTMQDWTFAEGMMSATVEVHPVTRANQFLGEAGFELDEEILLEACEDNFAGVAAMLNWTSTIKSNSGNNTGGPDDVDRANEENEGGLGTSALVGIAVGVGIAAIATASVCFCIFKSRQAGK